MLDIFAENSFLIPMFPIYAALVILFVNTKKFMTTLITLVSSGLGILFSIGLVLYILNGGGSFSIDLPFLSAGEYNFTVGILADKLSAMMLFVVTSISFVVQLYSYWYMKEKKGYNRFFIFLNLFMFAMICLVISTNLFQMYIFWELVGISSFLLIGYWYQKPSAKSAALKALLINRIGDFGFLASIVALCGFTFYFYKFDYLNMLGDVNILSFNHLAVAADGLSLLISPTVYFLICFGFILAICAKSAQFPLHTWLADAMEAPTPVSALIHAATMVAAGVYLLARIFPLLSQSRSALILLATLAALTSIFMSVIAVYQKDIKKMLAHSTSAQLGLMVTAIASGGVGVGIFHLLTHSYFKALLFLASGVIIHAFFNNQNMENMGGLRKKKPFLALIYLIGVMAISGIIFSGFFSKEAILVSIYQTNKFFFHTVLLTSFFTIIYMFKSYFLIFEGENKTEINDDKDGVCCMLPLVLLAIPSVCLGYIVNELLIKIHAPVFVSVCSVSVIVLSLIVSVFLYTGKHKFNIPVGIKKILENKLYFDNIYNVIFCRPYYYISKIIAIFDKYVVDMIVNGISFLIQLLSKTLLFFQTGNVSTYLILGVFGFSIALLVLIFGFSVYILGGI